MTGKLHHGYAEGLTHFGQGRGLVILSSLQVEIISWRNTKTYA